MQLRVGTWTRAARDGVLPGVEVVSRRHHPIQLQLGYVSPDTTARYVRLTEVINHDCRARVNDVVAPLGALFEQGPRA